MRCTVPVPIPSDLATFKDTNALRKLLPHLPLGRAVYLRPPELHGLGNGASLRPALMRWRMIVRQKSLHILIHPARAHILSRDVEAFVKRRRRCPGACARRRGYVQGARARQRARCTVGVDGYSRRSVIAPLIFSRPIAAAIAPELNGGRAQKFELLAAPGSGSCTSQSKEPILEFLARPIEAREL
jgi:hypothetical protein